MGNKYICPKCRGRLDVHEYVAFAAKSKDKEMGLVLLRPHLGTYEVWHNDSFKYDKGELVKYYCPVCHADLTAEEHHEHLVKIHMFDDAGVEHNILFSGVAGEQATYQIRDEELQRYGEHAEMYMDFFSCKMM